MGLAQTSIFPLHPLPALSFLPLSSVTWQQQHQRRSYISFPQEKLAWGPGETKETYKNLLYLVCKTGILAQCPLCCPFKDFLKTNRSAGEKMLRSVFLQQQDPGYKPKNLNQKWNIPLSYAAFVWASSWNHSAILIRSSMAASTDFQLFEWNMMKAVNLQKSTHIIFLFLSRAFLVAVDREHFPLPSSSVLSCKRKHILFILHCVTLSPYTKGSLIQHLCMHSFLFQLISGWV